jgi:hypothetical protein
MQPSPPVGELVDRWVAIGIITADQAQRIRADIATVPSAPRRSSSMIAEALGYLGGIIVLVGVGLVLALQWRGLSPDGRVGLAGAVAVAFGVAGAWIPAPRLAATGARLRGVLWLLGCAAAFACLALVGNELLHWDGNHTLLLAGGGASVASGVLWWLHRHVLQHLALVASLFVTVAAGAAIAINAPVGPRFAMWGFGVVWFLLSLPGIVPARSGGVLGGVSATIGAISMINENWGPVLALATVVAMVIAAVLRRELAVLGVASVGTLIVLPISVDRYFPGALSAALALVLGGLVLVLVAVYAARRRPRLGSGAPTPAE